MPTLTEEEWECIRVCVSNAPIPYDITKKKVPAAILQKIGKPIRIEAEGMPNVKYDLTQHLDMSHQNSTVKAFVTSYSPEPEAKPENKTEEKEYESLEEALTGE